MSRKANRSLRSSASASRFTSTSGCSVPTSRRRTYARSRSFSWASLIICSRMSSLVVAEDTSTDREIYALCSRATSSARRSSPSISTNRAYRFPVSSKPSGSRRPREGRWEAAGGNVAGIEGAVDRLAGRDGGGIRGVEQQDVGAGTRDLAPDKHVFSHRWRTVGRPPEGNSAHAGGLGRRLVEE